MAVDYILYILWESEGGQGVRSGAVKPGVRFLCCRRRGLRVLKVRGEAHKLEGIPSQDLPSALWKYF